jgi:uncharacterized cupin superfamily protein
VTGAPSSAGDTGGVDAFNLLRDKAPNERDRPGYGGRWERVGDRLGSELIGGTVYELPAGEQTFPYHYHHGVEEWLLVIDGAPVVRTPDGDRELRGGDVVCFPSGDAHAVRGPGRVLILAANRSPSISVYPDSDKIGTRPGQPGDDWLTLPRSAAVDYWEVE